MIGLLSGRLLSKDPPHLLLDVGGVGYELEVPLSTFEKLPDVGAQLTLHTHLTVREDAHILFAFATPAEKSLFRELIKLNGVGPKLALAILSGLSVGEFGGWFARRMRSGSPSCRASAERPPSVSCWNSRTRPKPKQQRPPEKSVGLPIAICWKRAVHWKHSVINRRKRCGCVTMPLSPI